MSLGGFGFRLSGSLGRVPRILAAVLQTKTAKDIKNEAAAPPHPGLGFRVLGTRVR